VILFIITFSLFDFKVCPSTANPIEKLTLKTIDILDRYGPAESIAQNKTEHHL